MGRTRHPLDRMLTLPLLSFDLESELKDKHKFLDVVVDSGFDRNYERDLQPVVKNEWKRSLPSSCLDELVSLRSLFERSILSDILCQLYLTVKR